MFLILNRDALASRFIPGILTLRLMCMLALAAVLITLAACGGNAPGMAGADNRETPGTASSAAEQSNKPVAMPGAFPMMGGVPLNVHLFDAGSYDPNGEIVMWEWNFGDAAPGEPAWQDYTASQGEAWHLYTKPGMKVAHLRVTDNDGNKDVAFVKIEMSQDGNANPVAVAAANPVFGYIPLMVSLDADGSYDPDGNIIMWEWDFDDGLGFRDFTATAGIASTTFYSAGNHTAVLRVTDDDGAVSTDGIDITTLPPSPLVDGANELAGLSPSLAFGPDGLPSISYHSEAPSYDLKYARWSGSDWHVEVVENLPVNADVYDGTSLAFNSLGEPSISYLHHIIPNWFNGKLWFASKEGASWSTAQIPDNQAVGQESSLKYDSQGHPVIVYHQFIPFSGGVKMARWNGSAWEVSHIDSNTGETGGVFPSLALDSLDNPHVTYAAGGGSYGAGELCYASFDGASWSYEVVDTGLGGAWPYSLISTSLALSAMDSPSVAYRDAINQDLKFACLTEDGWQVETVESTGDVGCWCSLAISLGGAAFVSFHDLADQSVKLATRSPKGQWSISVVESNLGSTDPGSDTYTSLALDPAGNPAVAYYDAGNGALKYALCN